MNELEKQIEGIDDIEEDKEEDTIKHRINRNRDDDRKRNIIIYTIVGVLAVVLIGLIIYMSLNDDKSENNINNNDEVVNGDVTDDNNEEKLEENIGYVSCDDNTALLNVRNSTNGDIIDGLSCYKMVTIEEEQGSTDTCDNWYKISYDKNGSNYTGYSCGTYIKKLEVPSTVIDTTRSLVDKANNYYENSVLTAFCGNTRDTKTITFSDNMTGEYVKSEYNNIEELKSYILSFLDEDLINIKLELSDINNPKYYDNYYEIDGSLYCRNYSGKGWNSYYTGNYDIEISNYSDNVIKANIAYQYIDENSDCNKEELSKCSRSDFVYNIGKVVITDGIITDIDFHK